MPGRHPRPARRAAPCSTRPGSATCSTPMAGWSPKLAAYSAGAAGPRDAATASGKQLIESAEFRDARAGAAGIRARRAGGRRTESRANTTSWPARPTCLRNAGQIRSTAAAGYSLLYEADRSAQDVLSRVARSLEPLCDAAARAGERRSRPSSGSPTRHAKSPSACAGLAEGWGEDPARLEDAGDADGPLPPAGDAVPLLGPTTWQSAWPRPSSSWSESTAMTASWTRSRNRWPLAWAALKARPVRSHGAPEARQGISAAAIQKRLGRSGSPVHGCRSRSRLARWATIRWCRPHRVGRRPGRDALLGKPRRRASPAAQDRLGRRAVAIDSCREDCAGGRRSACRP